MPVCGNNKKETGEKCDGNCPKSCANQGCQSFVIQGAACQAECVPGPQITRPVNGDDCCPDNANVGNDNDCAPRCGDGVVTSPQEICDPKSSTTCPTRNSCVSMGCMRAEFSGSTEQCTSKCERTTITSIAPGDGCCPKGATANEDSDCGSMCGNGEAEPGEECDIGGKSNFSDGRMWDRWSCDDQCHRRYLGTPCATDSDCGPSGICGTNGTGPVGFCFTRCTNSSGTGVAPCTVSGKTGYCPAGMPVCIPDCNPSVRDSCPPGLPCIETSPGSNMYGCYR